MLFKGCITARSPELSCRTRLFPLAPAARHGAVAKARCQLKHQVAGTSWFKRA